MGSFSWVGGFAARCLLAVASGGVYSLAFPPVNLGWLVIPGIGGLLLALEGQSGSRARTIGFLHGMAVFGSGVSWLYHIFGASVMTLFCVLAVFTALFAEFQSLAAAAGVRGWRWAMFTALNWGGWELIRAEVFPLKFPWMTAGLAMGPNRLLPLVGVYGVGMMVVLATVLLVSRRRAAVAVFGVLMAAKIGPMSPPGVGKKVKAAAVQLENAVIDDYLAASRDAPADVEYFAWPEYAVGYDLRKTPRDWEAVREFCREREATLTLGTQVRHTLDVWENVALTLDAEGERGSHTKVHTVHFFDDGVAGTKAEPVGTRFGKVGTPICFDCDYQDVIRKMTNAGAEMIFAPTMDAESWTARQHDQHAELFRIRACENGRWILVAATSGVSQIIDAGGGVRQSLPALEQGVLVGTMERRTGKTFFTRAGWLIPWLALGAAAVWWVGLAWRAIAGRWRKRNATS